MLKLVFMFMSLNLTTIWKLPTFSTGGRGRDGVPRIIGPGAGFFVHDRARKSALGTIPRWGLSQNRPIYKRTSTIATTKAFKPSHLSPYKFGSPSSITKDLDSTNIQAKIVHDST